MQSKTEQTPYKQSSGSERTFIDQSNILERTRRYVDASLNVCLVGPPGSGKTTLVHQLAGSMSNMRTAVGSEDHLSDLVGSLRLENGSTVWRTGPLIEAAEKGLLFYADELTGFDPACLRLMHTILDFRRTAIVTANSREFEVHPNFRFIASCNLSPTNLDPLAREFRDRLVYVNIERLDGATEAKLLVDRYQISNEDADWLIRFANATRTFDPRQGASTRQLEAAALSIKSGVDRLNSAKDCILNSIAGISVSQRDSLMKAMLAEGLAEHANWASVPLADAISVTNDEEIWS